MTFAALLFTLLSVTTGAPPVPGGCEAPPPEDADAPGCFLAARMDIDDAPPALYWFIYELRDHAVAEHEAKHYPHSVKVTAHGRTWLLVLDGAAATDRSEGLKAVIGPLETPRGGPVEARFLESLFPPGLQTRTHAHPGPEAFYVVDGEQCVETPAGHRLIRAGEHYILTDGPHLQSSPHGRRSLVLLLVPRDRPWMTLQPQWTPRGLCADIKSR